MSEYKIVDGELIAKTPEEVVADVKTAEFENFYLTMVTPTNSERIAALESAMLAMMGGGL